MAVGFPPQPVYPNGIDSDYTLFVVYNTTESALAEDNDPWSEEITIVPRTNTQPEIWADNGFGNINGELFYYDSVVKDSNGKVTKLKRCARNLSGMQTQFNIAGTMVRGFVVAEHHNQLVDGIILTEKFIGENFSTDPTTIDFRVRQLGGVPIIFDDFGCPDVNFFFTTKSSDPSSGTVVHYKLDVTGSFNQFTLTFGDGTSTSSIQEGDHTYPPNANIDPVVTFKNDRCQIVQTPTERDSVDAPTASTVGGNFASPNSPVFVFPNITITPPVFPETDIALPPFQFPCIDLSPLGISPVNIPSVIVFQPPINLPSVIEFEAIDIPSLIMVGGMEIPSLISVIVPDISIIAPDIVVPDINISLVLPSFPMISLEVPTFPNLNVNIPTFPNLEIDVPTFPDIGVDWGDAPTVEFGSPPSLVIDWGTPPTLDCICWDTPPDIVVDWGEAPSITIDWGSAPGLIVNWGAPPDVAFNWGSPPDVSFDWGSPPHVTFTWGSPPTVSMTWGSAPNVSITWGSPPAVTVSWGSPPTVTVSWGAVPNVPITWGTAPNVSVTWGTPPNAGITWGTPPTVNVNWGSPPTIQVNVTVTCPSTPLALAATDPIGITEDMMGIGKDIEVAYDISGFPSEVKMIPPDIPDVRILHDIPSEITIRTPVFPNLKVDVPDFRDIRILPPETQLTIEAIGIPDIIRLESTFTIPDKIELIMPIRIPETIVLDASGLPDVIRVEGLPDVIRVEHTIPNTIKLEMPDKPEIELVYKGSPIPVQIELDIKKLIGNDENLQCVAIVPCKKF